MYLSLLLTCEHGGNRVPARYRDLFRGAGRVLSTHRGLDIGALEAARFLARQLDAPLISATVTRLLVDLNRSIGHPRLYSEYTRGLPATERAAILAHHYLPYRNAVARWLRQRLARGGAVLHISVHSFTPVLAGKLRDADIGLLYDPGRRREAALAGEWQRRLQALAPDLVVRRNYPYRGIADGFIPALRGELPAGRYFGLEIEINQRATLGDHRHWRRLLRVIARSVPLGT